MPSRRRIISRSEDGKCVKLSSLRKVKEISPPLLDQEPGVSPCQENKKNPDITLVDNTVVRTGDENKQKNKLTEITVNGVKLSELQMRVRLSSTEKRTKVKNSTTLQKGRKKSAKLPSSGQEGKMLRYLLRKKEEEVPDNVIYEHHHKTNSEYSDTRRHI